MTASPARRLVVLAVVLAAAATGCRGGGTDAVTAGTDEQGFARVYVQAPRHPTGAFVRVSGVTVDSDRISLQVGLTHAKDRPVEFNDAGTTVTDAAGTTYPLVPPADNPKLEIRPGALLSGTLVFTVAEGAPRGPLTLTFNDGSHGSAPGSDDSTRTTTPLVTVADIPL